ncbi:galactose mutarotase [Gemmobacter nanjingensis]|jgi:aldose 1-epimerase|uniref:Galactose mutarotase n=1 Tax=Gemmobacter nanjingensis TaxID=488454 RepID=A0ABQ3FGY3_9RHOB|nr:aldose epimerase family protein [Gemmobacter nanjingensis]GHC23022.1 galactose mutarotase [Gemmobacter nanjingensis]
MIREFGQTAAGEAVQAVTLRAGKLGATILTYGAILQDLRLSGLGYSLTRGSEDLAEYEGALSYHGAVIGPVANRIAGARADIGGLPCQFEANEGANCLHSGGAGLHRKVWRIETSGEDHLTLVCDLAAGEGGFPGNRQVRAEWRVSAPATLHLRLTLTTDADTPAALTNHSYWNLDGSADWSGHQLRIVADRVTETDAALLPTGRLTPVAGGDLDFRAGRRIWPGEPALDTNFCLSNGPQPLRDVLWLTGKTGVEMVVATTEPGVQVYDNRIVSRRGAAPYEALAIEPQFWPDALHQPGFPSVLLRAGETREQRIRWRFGT